MDVVLDAELGGSAKRLVLLARPDLRVPRVLRRGAVGHDDDAHASPAIDVSGDRPTHPQYLVVGVRGDHEDPRHPSRAPDRELDPRRISTSSSRSPPSPHATTAPSGLVANDRARPDAAASSSTGRALQTTTFSSPRNVNAPGYGRVCARTQS